MRYLLLIFITVGATFSIFAQTEPKNELSLGYFSAGEFFDTSALKLSRFTKGRNFSLKYTRSVGKKISLALTYSRCLFSYGLPRYPSGEPIPNSITVRYQRTLTADAGIRFTKWSLLMRAKAGLRYNILSEKNEYHYGGWHNNGWYEGFGAVDEYGKVGASMGLSIAHPIFWRIFGELDSEFAKMFSGADRNQLLLSYRIGIRF